VRSRSTPATKPTRRARRKSISPRCAATPARIHARLHGDLVKAIESPDLRERLTGQLGVDPVTSTPEALARFSKSEIEKWTKAAQEAAAAAAKSVADLGERQKDLGTKLKAADKTATEGAQAAQSLSAAQQNHERLLQVERSGQQALAASTDPVAGQFSATATGADLALVNAGAASLGTLTRRMTANLPASWAMRLCDFPQGIFVMALQAAALPSLARLATQGNQVELGRTFAFGMRLALFVAIPAVIAYNYFAEKVKDMATRMDSFSIEFMSFVSRTYLRK